MAASPQLPPGVKDLVRVDPNPDPRAGELWRVGRGVAMLAWVRKAFPDGMLDVIPVTMDAEMADQTSVLLNADAAPLGVPLAALTAIRTHLPRSVFLTRICVLGIAEDVEEVIRADRVGRLPMGVWVGPAITEDDDERITFRQQLMALLYTWSSSATSAEE